MIYYFIFFSDHLLGKWTVTGKILLDVKNVTQNLLHMHFQFRGHTYTLQDSRSVVIFNSKDDA